jgi:hypothetical protein
MAHFCVGGHLQSIFCTAAKELYRFHVLWEQLLKINMPQKQRVAGTSLLFMM